MKKGINSTPILIIIFLAGLSLLLYPTVSDYWNSLHQSRAVASYVEKVADLDDDKYAELLADAQAYNERLALKGNRYRISDAEREEYNSLLDLAGNGIMGYIEIPSIGCYLPVYHGISGPVLQVAIGHIEWSSLPVGGIGTHSAVSGHRGLPSAKLFTNLDQLAVGDLFMMHVLDEVLTYEVDQILIVLPEELDALAIDSEKDLCTLVTCTPYGVNTHRMLVRGHRIETEEEIKKVRVTADAIRIDPLVMTPLVAAPMLVILFIWMIIPSKNKKEKTSKRRT